METNKAEEHLTEGSRARLRTQFEAITKRYGHNIVPPSMEADIFDTSIDEIKADGRRRLSLFLRSAASLHMPGKHKDPKLVREYRMIGGLNNLDRYIQDHESDEKKRTLKPRQLESFKKLRDFLERGGNAGYFKMPSGYGKTVLFIEFIEALGLKTLIVVPTTVLLKQTKRSVEKFASGLDANIIQGYAENRGQQVTIMTYKTFADQTRKGNLKPDDYDCVILDEVHRSLSENRMGAVRKFEKSIRLGFTATPFFSGDKNAAMLLENEVDRMDVDEAIEDGLLTSCRVMIAKTDTNLRKVQANKDTDYNQSELRRVVDNKRRNSSAVALYKKLFTGQKAIAYCAGINHAKNMAIEFESHGVKAGFIHGHMTMSQRERVLEMHTKGEIAVVCNADILIEGYDDVTISVGLNLRPTLSGVVAEQRGGRTIRLDDNNPLKFATIVDFIDIENIGKRSISYAQILEAAEVTNQRAPKYPELPKEIEIEGLKLYTEPKDVMRILGQRIEWKKRKEKEEDLMRKNWLQLKKLAKEIGKPQPQTLQLLAKLRKSHTEHFLDPALSRQMDEEVSIARRKGGGEYYNRALVDILKEEVKAQTAPAEWKTSSWLIYKLNIREEHIADVLLRYPEAEWSGVYLFPGGRPIRYFNPEIIDLIDRKVEEPPENYTLERILALELKVPYKEIRTTAKQFKAAYPQGVIDIRRYPRDKNPNLYYEPGLVKAITAHILSGEKYYLSIESFAAKLQTTAETLLEVVQHNKLTALFDESDGERLRLHIDKIDMVTEYVIPCLGWLTVEELGTKVKMNPRYIKNLISDLGSGRTQYIYYKKNEDKEKIAMYLHPELIQEVTTELNRWRPPEGWMATRAVRELIGGDSDSLRQIIRENLTDTRQVAIYLDKDGYSKRHLSPQLVKEVLADAKKLSDWPDLMTVSAQTGGLPAQVKGMVKNMIIKAGPPYPLYMADYDDKIRIDPKIVGGIGARIEAIKGWVGRRDMYKKAEKILGCVGVDTRFFTALFLRLQEEHKADWKWEYDMSAACKPLYSPVFEGHFIREVQAMKIWKTVPTLCQELQLSLSAVKQYLEDHEKENGGDQCRTGAGKTLTFIISPSLEQKIRNAFTPPQDWRSEAEVAASFSISTDDMNAKIAVLPETLSTEIVTKYVKKGNGEKTRYLSPNIVAILAGESLRPAPADWMTIEQMATVFQMDELVITLSIKELPKDLKPAPKNCLGAEGPALYYPPEYIVLIEKKLPPPDGWMTYVQLGQAEGVPPARIKQLADAQTVKNPQWARKYHDEDKGTYPTYLHPELVAMIKDSL